MQSGKAARWAQVVGSTLSGQIVAQIRAALFSGELRGGERIGSELSLAERFGVSRMAMRDALRSLAAAGIVEVRVGAKGGIYIAQGNLDRFADALAIQLKLVGISAAEILDAQIAIEVMSAELAARNAQPEDLARLRGLIGELEALLEAPDAFTAAALRFHEAVVEASRNRALAAQFRALRFVLEPLYARRTTPTVARRALASHRDLLACIERRDAEGARKLMRQRLAVIRARQLTAGVQEAE